jgi:hypothetical protein
VRLSINLLGAENNCGFPIRNSVGRVAANVAKLIIGDIFIFYFYFLVNLKVLSTRG